MHFKIGDRVSFLYQKGEGIVKSIQGDRIEVTDLESDFEIIFDKNELVKVNEALKKALYNEDYRVEMSEAESFLNFTNDINPHIRKEKEFWEIDLHTHMFMESEKGKSSGELLQKQIHEFKSFFNEAQERMVRRLIVIHGIGKGTLKQEIRTFLNHKGNIEFYDADFREYGKGATEIRLFYNV